MGFWIFMFIMNLLLPITMIGFGKYFIKSAPKEINSTFGYRTSMSMKNKDTWKFAHEYCGKLWYKLGWITLIVSLLPLLFVLGKDTETVGTVGGTICMLQLIPLIGSIFPTEKALKKNFDRHGNRRH